MLGGLVTDFWCAPGAAFNHFGNGLSERFHPELTEAKVRSANLSTALFELRSRARRKNAWQLILQRNSWFQNVSLTTLRDLAPTQGEQTSLFAFSYAASKILRFARERSWTTVLGQIDPGPTEEAIVSQLYEEAGLSRLWRPAPTQYWDDWRLECELADRIVVNSEWSRNALLREGISSAKIKVVPLAFEPGAEATSFVRSYPERFTEQRPLRVLFLGQINLRKGIRELLDAVGLLAGEPLEFWFVGPGQFTVPKELPNQSSIKWFGAVPRSDTGKYYREADLFIFPTHSDGFGLTQLEAQSWKLPVLTSTCCGEVVNDGRNGMILDHVSGESIAKALLSLIKAPSRLQKMSNQSGVAERYSLHSLSSGLVDS